MTSKELYDAYNAFLNIEDPMGWLEKNRKRAEEVSAKLTPIKNIAYGKEPIQKLDIYAPEGARNAPVLIEIHGGGWISGSKEPRSIPAEAIMSQGILWVPIDYGLAPQYTIDEIIDHIQQAISWVRENIARYGGSSDKLYIIGNSAGAHLAATTLMPKWHHDGVKGVVCVSGVFDMQCQFHANTESQQALKMTQDDAERTSPLRHLPEKKLPIILAYGENELDAFIDESTSYAKALQQVGCNVRLIEVKNANHFTIINELDNKEGALFKAVIEMITAEEL